MKKMLLLMCVVIFTVTANSYAATLDLSGWTADAYLLGGQPAGNWVLAADNKSVEQIINADPSVYLNGLNQTAYTMDGSWQVKTTSDDDFMGFVFGYQDDSHFYLMDWKQAQQGYAGTTAYEGLSIKKISATSRSDLDLEDFWSSAGTSDTTILATSYGSDKGWLDNTFYNFHLDFRNDGTFDVIVKLGTTELWNVTVADSSYTSGQFGFYNFSQSNVEYAGFEQTGGVIIDPIPEPATMLLFGLGLLGLAGVSRKKQ